MTDTDEGRLVTEWFEGLSPERARREAELVAPGFALPVRARSEWASVNDGVRSALLVVKDSAGVKGGIGLDRRSSRALPGHQVLHAWHVGVTLPEAAATRAISAIGASVKEDHRVLRVHVQVFSLEKAIRERLTSLLARYGYERVTPATSYETTLVTRLDRASEVHFASLSQGVRQNIKALSKYPVELRPIARNDHSARMNMLLRESLARTGAKHHDVDFGPIVRLSTDHPTLSHLVGLYRTDLAGPDSLVAFAWGVNQGDSVAYDLGASTRVPEFRNLSMGYPLVWELISWARSIGAPFFDFGGVTEGDAESGDRLGKISDFKRRFSKDAVAVAEEWVYNPRPVLSAIASASSKAAEFARRFRR
jgi:hypothetical protein